MSKQEFTFNISLSVLNHLGRNLYRNFSTILGEAISNSWDADADNVWITIDKKNSRLVVKDDGTGMTPADFQQKFLKIGYSKRKDGGELSPKKRPFIGRKGIGKLALLSCAQKISIFSKTIDTSLTGGTIDNNDLNQAITDDATPQDYALSSLNKTSVETLLSDFDKGTILVFDDINEGIKNSIEYLKKIVAMHFRFSLIDPNFKIYINDELISIKHMQELADNTQFLWQINYIQDDFLSLLTTSENCKEHRTISFDKEINGFIASVKKPRDTKVIGTNERVTVDLFVNGRLREKDILKHIPTSRIVENYVYGQIHYNNLDEKGLDRFTSSREGVLSEDPKYKDFLSRFSSQVFNEVLKDWDTWRQKHRDDGDPDNEQTPKTERKARELFNVVSSEYQQKKGSPTKETIDLWLDKLADDAQFNLSSYAQCFVSENIVRKYITHKNIPLSKNIISKLPDYKEKERTSKMAGNISIEIRDKNSDLNYLSMDDLAVLVDKKDPLIEACLIRDAKEYKPVRDALAHTSLLTKEAKIKLTSIYDNIKGRVKELLTNV